MKWAYHSRQFKAAQCFIFTLLYSYSESNACAIDRRLHSSRSIVYNMISWNNLLYCSCRRAVKCSVMYLWFSVCFSPFYLFLRTTFNKVIPLTSPDEQSAIHQTGSNKRMKWIHSYSDWRKWMKWFLLHSKSDCRQWTGSIISLCNIPETW